MVDTLWKKKDHLVHARLFLAVSATVFVRNERDKPLQMKEFPFLNHIMRFGCGFHASHFLLTTQ